MTLKQLFLLLIISISSMYAADTSSESDSSDVSDSSELLIFYDTIGGINIERRKTILTHFIEPTKKESLSHKTFQTLFDTNACAKNLPWIIATSITLNTYPTALAVDHFDLTEMLKEKAVHEIYDFSSEEAAGQTVEKKIRSLVHKKDINTHIRSSLHVIYYAVKHNMGFKAHDTSSSHITFTTEKNRIASISDLSCTLAISLHNDYSQLLPLIVLFQSDSSDNHHQNQKLSFWNKTFSSLPDEQQQQLLKESNERFGWELSISKPQSNV